MVKRISIEMGGTGVNTAAETRAVLSLDSSNTVAFAATELTDGATIDWDLSSNQVTEVSLGGDRTMAAPTNMANGAIYHLSVIQQDAGDNTITWNSVFLFAGGSLTLSTAPFGRDEITFRSNGDFMIETSRSLDVS